MNENWFLLLLGLLYFSTRQSVLIKVSGLTQEFWFVIKGKWLHLLWKISTTCFPLSHPVIYCVICKVEQQTQTICDNSHNRYQFHCATVIYYLFSIKVLWFMFVSHISIRSNINYAPFAWLIRKMALIPGIHLSPEIVPRLTIVASIRYKVSQFCRYPTYVG